MHAWRDEDGAGYLGNQYRYGFEYSGVVMETRRQVMATTLILYTNM